MEFVSLVKARRSVRSFEPTPLSEEQLRVLLEAATWAPSPLNLQPWEFVVITDPATKAKIRIMAEKARQKVLDEDGPGWVSGYTMDFLEEAPLLVAVVFDPSKKGLGDFFNQKQGALQAASAAIQNLMLAACEMGLGSLWFTFFDPEALRTTLDLPGHLDCAGLVLVGTPRKEPKAPPRKEAVLHRQYYGQ